MKFTILGYLALFFAFCAGFFICALFTIGKIVDLEERNKSLRRMLEK